jgi:hypothetical protein
MVFDDELEFDRETRFADCRVFSSEGGVVLFENPEGTVRGETLQSRLQFHRLPTGLQKISVSIDSDVRLRLSHAVCDVPYLLSRINGLSPAPGRIAVRYNVAHPTAALSLSRTLRYAAAAVLVLGSALVLWLVTRPSSEIPIVETPSMIESDTTNAIPDKEEPGIDETIVPKDRERQKTAPSRTFAFESNPVLETYLDRHYRGSPVEFGTVRVLQEKRAASFEWTSEEPVTVDISLVDNTNREIWRGGSQTPPLETKARLSPGLYYWFARVDGEIARVGKFKIR